MTERHCPTCGKDMPAGAKICEGCGTPLQPELQSNLVPSTQGNPLQLGLQGNDVPPTQPELQGKQTLVGESPPEEGVDNHIPVLPSIQTQATSKNTPANNIQVSPNVPQPSTLQLSLPPNADPAWKFVGIEGKTIMLFLARSWKQHYFGVLRAGTVVFIVTLLFLLFRYVFSVGGKLEAVVEFVDTLSWFVFYPINIGGTTIIVVLLVGSAVKIDPYLRFSIDNTTRMLILEKGWKEHQSSTQRFPLSRVVGFANGYFAPGTSRRQRYESLWLLINKKDPPLPMKIFYGLTKDYRLTTMADSRRARVFVHAMNDFLKQHANITSPI